VNCTKTGGGTETNDATLNNSISIPLKHWFNNTLIDKIRQTITQDIMGTHRRKSMLSLRRNLNVQRYQTYRVTKKKLKKVVNKVNTPTVTTLS
jgi:hypothetical protein